MINQLRRLASDELWLGMIAFEQTGSVFGMVSVVAADLATRTGHRFVRGPSSHRASPGAATD